MFEVEGGFRAKIVVECAGRDQIDLYDFECNILFLTYDDAIAEIKAQSDCIKAQIEEKIRGRKACLH